MTTAISIELLGGFALMVDGAPAPVLSGRVQVLLAYLALHRTQQRRRLAFALWPDSSEAQAQTNLRTLLHRLQSAIPGAERLLHADQLHIGWSAAASLSVDAAEFEADLDQARSAEAGGRAAEARGALERAVGRYRGDLLPECYDEWVVPERERLRQLLLDALGRLVALLDERRDYALALEHARRLVALDALNEAAALSLLRLHDLLGDRAAALRVYHACATRLKEDLGAAPGHALRAAYERLVDDPPAIGAPGPDDAPLIGRDAEWHCMQHAWRLTEEGGPRMLVLSGEAGIGKSRLANDLLRWARGAGAATAEAHCYAAEGELAYAPVVAWLRSDALRPELTRLDAPWLAEIGRLAPDLLGGRPGATQAAPAAGEWQRRRLFEALALAVTATSRTLMLLLDDMQWCDHETLGWLHYLLRYEGAGRLIVVGTMRVEEAQDSQALASLLGALRREGRLSEIDLGPLGREESAAVAEHIVGRPLTGPQAARLHEETEGNPLFVVEHARAVLLGAQGAAESWWAGGEVDGAGGLSAAVGQPLPAQPPPRERRGVISPAIQAVVDRRLMQVSPPARELLRVAAVIGRSFTLAVLGRVAEAREGAVVRGLEELWQRRIVREHGADDYDFTHEKLRVAAYASLSPARRRLLHRRVAEALEAEHADDLDRVSGRIAAHYELAGLVVQAAQYERRAAAAAQQVYANQEALDRYRHALRLLGPDHPSETGVLHERMGDLLHLLGRNDEARLAWRRALADTREQDLVRLADLHRKIGNAWRDQYRYAEAARAYAAAEGMLPCERTELREAVMPTWAQIQLERFTMSYWLGQVSEMLRLVERIGPVVQWLGDEAQRARLHQISAIALLRRDRYVSSAEVVGHARAYLAAVQLAGSASAEPAARFQLGFVLLWSASVTDAETELAHALELAERSGDISLVARCLTYLALAARTRSDPAAVRGYAERALRVAQDTLMHDYIGAAHGNLAWLAWRAGDMDGVYSHCGAALDAWRSLPTPYMFEWVARWPQIAHDLARGDVVSAGAHARILVQETQQRPAPALESMLAAAVRAAEAGELETVRVQLEAALVPARLLGHL